MKVLIAVLLLTVNFLFAQTQTLSDYSTTMDECFRVPLETKTICCMADKNGDKRFGNKVLLLLDSQNNVLDEFSFYDANNSGTFFASNTAFVLKGKITEPFQNILIYVSDDDVSFKNLIVKTGWRI